MLILCLLLAFSHWQLAIGFCSSAKLKNFAENTTTAENNLYICREKTLNSAHYGTP